MTFYFAWVDKSETVFGPEHHRVDEEVFALRLEHSEGDFPTADVDLINPRIGLLTSSRKQWVWIAYDDGNDVTPLFFGRVLGVPQALQDEVIRVTFVARPHNYEQQREVVASALRVLPYYDPLWFSEDERNDPDSVLEGYSRVWHIDRVTHEVTTSDIITGEDGTVVFDEQREVFYDSVDVSVGQSPARKAVVTASVRWEQYGVGSVDITPDLLEAFRKQTPAASVVTIDGMARSTNGMITIMCGDELLDQWPSPGDRVGSGWSVGSTQLKVVGGHPLPPLITDMETRAAIAGHVTETGLANAIRGIFGRAPGLAISVVDYSNPLIGKNQLLWVPIYRMSARMAMDYEVGRNRSEAIEFEVSADVQSILSDPDDEETVFINVGTADVDVPVDGAPPIGTPRRKKYFETDRGHQSFEHLLARARAVLLYRSRAVDIGFSVPFAEGLSLSCRKSATLVDPRLPGGMATGKIKSYTLIADGNGDMYASVTIGCAVGRGGSPTPVEGEPVYVENGYVNPGYQFIEGAVLVPSVGDVSYDDYSGYAISDDGVDMLNITRQTALRSITVTGGLQKEIEQAQPNVAASSSVEAIERVSSVETVLRIEMQPLAGGPFDSALQPTVHMLTIPKLIDLEAE